MPLKPLLQDVRILADSVLEQSDVSWNVLKEVAMAGKNDPTDEYSLFIS